MTQVASQHWHYLLSYKIVCMLVCVALSNCMCVRACVHARARARVCACVRVIAYDTSECGLFEYPIKAHIFKKRSYMHVCMHVY